jgi:hypothetical protein
MSQSAKAEIPIIAAPDAIKLTSARERLVMPPTSLNREPPASNPHKVGECAGSNSLRLVTLQIVKKTSIGSVFISQSLGSIDNQ